MSTTSPSQSKINHALNRAFDKSVYYFYNTSQLDTSCNSILGNDPLLELP